VILNTNGNICGGFTPVKWEPRKWNGKSGKEDNCHKADPSLKSFLFTLTNPHNVPARRFALKGEEKDRAIKCYFGGGPDCDFGHGGSSENRFDAHSNPKPTLITATRESRISFFTHPRPIYCLNCSCAGGGSWEFA
jgi:hypothetical protein